jgi:uncharacterized lipoprotein NlpE involved in copper resistance
MNSGTDNVMPQGISGNGRFHGRRIFMKTQLSIVIGILIIVGCCVPGISAASPFQIKGEHYNLNIIGVKVSDQIKEVGDSMGHTMFVKLNGKTRIMMTQDAGGIFEVVDRNGLDGLTRFNIAPGHYNVYARALGKPNGNVHIQANGTFNDSVNGETLVMLGYVDITRSTGKPQSLNINSLFYVDVSVCTASLDGVCIEMTTYNDTWVFDIPELLSYYWDYDNNELKLLQVRFYPCTLDPTGTANDYCRWENGAPIDSTKQSVVPA